MTGFVVLANGSLIPSFGAAKQQELKRMPKKEKKQYRLINDFVIPAGTEVDADPPHKRVTATDHALITIAVTNDTTAYWSMDLEEAIEEGIVEEVPQGEPKEEESPVD